MHKFSTAATTLIRPDCATRKRVPPRSASSAYSLVRLREPLVARGATHPVRRFRRFVTRTYA